MCDYTGRPTQLGRPLRLWRARPPSPRHCVGLPVLVCMLLQGNESESEEVVGEVSVCDVCVHVAPPTSSAVTSSPCSTSSHFAWES